MIEIGGMEKTAAELDFLDSKIGVVELRGSVMQSQARRKRSDRHAQLSLEDVLQSGTADVKCAREIVERLLP